MYDSSSRFFFPIVTFTLFLFMLITYSWLIKELIPFTFTKILRLPSQFFFNYPADCPKFSSL